jgi:hypothetical protein
MRLLAREGAGPIPLQVVAGFAALSLLVLGGDLSLLGRNVAGSHRSTSSTSTAHRTAAGPVGATANASAAATPGPVETLAGVPQLLDPVAVLPGLPTGDGAALADRLVALPAGAVARPFFAVASANVVLARVQTLSQFATGHFKDATATETVLRQRGFQVAAEEGWREANGDLVDDQLAEFATAGGAEGELDGQQGAYTADTTITSSYAVPFDEGEGFVRPSLDSDGNRRTFLTARVGNVYVLDIFYTKAAIAPATCEAVLSAQIRALLAS